MRGRVLVVASAMTAVGALGVGVSGGAPDRGAPLTVTPIQVRTSPIPEVELTNAQLESSRQMLTRALRDPNELLDPLPELPVAIIKRTGPWTTGRGVLLGTVSIVDLLQPVDNLRVVWPLMEYDTSESMWPPYRTPLHQLTINKLQNIYVWQDNSGVILALGAGPEAQVVYPPGYLPPNGDSPRG